MKNPTPLITPLKRENRDMINGIAKPEPSANVNGTGDMRQQKPSFVQAKPHLAKPIMAT
jgi:hypothetical protein